MRKIILTLVGAVLIANSTNQIAFSKEHHHVHKVKQFNSKRFRNAKANAVPCYVRDVGSAYTGLAGAWESMTGFN